MAPSASTSGSDTSKSSTVTSMCICCGTDWLGHCGDGSRYDMELAYAFDGDKLMGTGGAVKRAEHLLRARPGDPFQLHSVHPLRAEPGPARTGAAAEGTR